ncbi:hypothetical protein D3C76_76900 [compost metagenome]
MVRIGSEADRDDVISRKSLLFRLFRTQEPLYRSFKPGIKGIRSNRGICVRLIC